MSASAPDPSATLDRLLHVVDLLGRDSAAQLGARGLTMARAHVLWAFGGRDEATAGGLAAAVGVAPRTMTGLVDSLEAGGFVVRRPHPTDRRATLVCLTDRGRETTSWLAESHADLATTLFSSMSPERHAHLDAGLAALVERLSGLVAAADGAGHE